MEIDGIELSSESYEKLDAATLNYTNSGIECAKDMDEFKILNKIEVRLHGGRHHAKMMALLQYEIYGCLKPDLVEKNNYDLLDNENLIMAEVGSIRGRLSEQVSVNLFKSRVRRFLQRLEVDESEDWSFYYLPYGSGVIYTIYE